MTLFVAGAGHNGLLLRATGRFPKGVRALAALGEEHVTPLVGRATMTTGVPGRKSP